MSDFVTAYVQQERAGPHNQEDYLEFLNDLQRAGIKNVATWHLETGNTNFTLCQNNLFRNLRQIREADVVITRLIHGAYEFYYVAAISLISYALALGKPCYIIASNTCVIWENPIMFHPLITHVGNTQSLIREMKLL